MMENENWIYGKVWDQEGNPKYSIRDEEVTSGKLSADSVLSQEDDDYRRRRSIYLKSYSLKKAKSNADIRRHISTASKFLYRLKKLVSSGHHRRM